MTTKFKNEAFTNFSTPENKKIMEDALTKVASSFGEEYPIVIDGEKIICTEKIKSTNPSDHKIVVGTAQKGTLDLAEKAISAAWTAFDTWRFTAASERADYLFKMADVMRRRKYELASWMVYEVGKSWAEADGDVAEAIDFCDFYAHEAIRYGEGRKCLPWPGETNHMRYIPIGVGAAIPPWNFPLAILVGVTVGPVAAGNTVVLKPASDTPVIASKFMEIVEEVGLPKGVINFVTGSGSDVGETLVKHPRIRFVNFTGSREVGLHIVEECGKTRPGQKWIKSVMAEMGGKDSMIVDSEADIDAAVDAAAVAAFGFSGQKCSACSRAIVDEKVYDEFVTKLAERTREITVGETKDSTNWMGPVSSKAAYDKICDYIEVGKGEGKLLCGGESDDKTGYFIQPTVFTDIEPTARLSQEEIFGPVLAVIKAKDFDDAIGIFNNTEYGLTGGVFTKNKEKIERAKNECYCGNFYVNRKITGALVAVQPFGGYNMSGTCSKAGGWDYLGLFLQGKSIAEKITE